MTTGRTTSFQRNAALETLLARLNAALADTKVDLVDAPRLPPLIVLGPPRSGTTYCMQWLAASGAFSYPSNLIARFWQAPAIGAMCQQMLSDPAFDFRGEFSDLSFTDVEENSELGKTRGLMSPNEFWYFWRAAFPGDGDIGITLSKATPAQFEAFDRKLQEFAQVRGKPVATKGMIVNHQVATLATALPDALFLCLDRTPKDAAWSLLRARERMHGDRDSWYSFKTPNHVELSALPAPEQVMGQIDTIRQDLRRQLDALPSDRHLTLDYAALCEEPGAAFDRLRVLFDRHGVTLEGQNSFAPTAVSRPEIPQDVNESFDNYLSR